MEVTTNGSDVRRYHTEMSRGYVMWNSKVDMTHASSYEDVQEGVTWRRDMGISCVDVVWKCYVEVSRGDFAWKRGGDVTWRCRTT